MMGSESFDEACSIKGGEKENSLSRDATEVQDWNILKEVTWGEGWLERGA